MSPAFLIARSEYLRRVRTRSFVIGTVAAPLMLLLFPLLMGAFVTVSLPAMFDDPELFEDPDPATSAGVEREALPPLVLGVVGPQAEGVAAAAPDTVRAVALARGDTALARLADDRLDALAVLAPAADSATLAKVVVGVYQSRWREAYDVAFDATSRAKGAAGTGQADTAAAPSVPEPDAAPGLSEFEQESLTDLLGMFRTLAAIMAGGLISFLPGLYGGAVLRGVIEEKTDRVAEILVSSVRPFELLMGKVLGIGAVGLTQLAFWGALAALAAAGASAAVGAVAGGVLAEPGIGIDEAQVVLAGVSDAVTVPLVAVLVLLFLGGYLLTSSLYAAIGSAVDKEADAQHLMAPIGLFTTLPLFALPLVAAAPDGPLAVVLSLVPPVSPAVMTARLVASTVPGWQVALSLALLAVSFAATTWFAARVYRVGILMTGTTPSLADVWRWARTP